MSAVAEKLRAARARIAKGWTQRASARTKGGVPVWGGDDRAICWCAVGALQGSPEAIPLVRKAIGIPDECRISTWNDAPERTQAEVLAAFDKAIELVERDQ